MILEGKGGWGGQDRRGVDGKGQWKEGERLDLR